MISIGNLTICYILLRWSCWSWYPLALSTCLPSSASFTQLELQNYLSQDHQSLCCKIVHFFMFLLKLAFEALWSRYPLALSTCLPSSSTASFTQLELQNYLSKDHQSLCCKIVHIITDIHLKLAVDTETDINMIMISIGTLYLFAQHQKQHQLHPTWIASVSLSQLWNQRPTLLKLYLIFGTNAA